MPCLGCAAPLALLQARAVVDKAKAGAASVHILIGDSIAHPGRYNPNSKSANRGRGQGLRMARGAWRMAHGAYTRHWCKVGRQGFSADGDTGKEALYPGDR